jgi:Tfp pilus assembly protein PilO
MAELDPQQVEPIEPVEPVVVPVETVVEPVAAAPVIIDETPTVVTTRRPQNIYSGMWGPLEIGAVSVSALALLLSFLVYFFLVVPSNRELAHNKSESDRLSAELMSANSKYGEITDTQSQVSKILSSVDDFETRFLPTISTGQSALYQRLNGLIHGYGLVNTTGPDYAPLETLDSNANQSEEEKGRAKFRSLYPGVYVTMTVEGSYQNLRRFIREIETGRDFIVISAIELAPSDNESQRQPDEKKPVPINPNKMTVGPNGKLVQGPNPAAPAVAQVNQNKGKAHGEFLALHLEMAAYFRRPGFVPMTNDTVEQ